MGISDTSSRNQHLLESIARSHKAAPLPEGISEMKDGLASGDRVAEKLGGN